MSIIDEYILKFPQNWQINLGNSVDEAVKSFSRNHQTGLRAVKDTVISIVGSIQYTLEAIPWIVLVLFVTLLTWFFTKKWYIGVIFGVLLTFVGCCGLWLQMLQTLSIVIASVVWVLAYFSASFLDEKDRRWGELIGFF